MRALPRYGILDEWAIHRFDLACPLYSVVALAPPWNLAEIQAAVLTQKVPLLFCDLIVPLYTHRRVARVLYTAKRSLS
jgi:hypothetical protein